MVALLQRARENNGLHSRHRRVSLLCHHLKCVASHQQRVELLEKPGEVDLRVHDNPVGLALWSCNVSVQTHRHLVTYSPHGLLRAHQFSIYLAIITHVTKCWRETFSSTPGSVCCPFDARELRCVRLLWARLLRWHKLGDGNSQAASLLLSLPCLLILLLPQATRPRRTRLTTFPLATFQ